LPVPGFGEGLMEDPVFDLKWVDSVGNVMSVKLLSAQQEHYTVSLRWDYFLEVEANAIPLNNSLLIDTSLRRGTTHYQLAARLSK